MKINFQRNQQPRIEDIMKIKFECGEDSGDVIVDGKVVATVNRDEDSATATIRVIEALAPLMGAEIEE
jgi:hypothetical protein